jgi:hypothetical protein
MSAIASDLDAINLTGLSIGAVVLALVFRTLWKQEGGWRSVLNASREDAHAARLDAAAAREDAGEARSDARQARLAEQECRVRLSRLEDRLDKMQLQRDTDRSDDQRRRTQEGNHP